MGEGDGVTVWSQSLHTCSWVPRGLRAQLARTRPHEHEPCGACLWRLARPAWRAWPGFGTRTPPGLFLPSCVSLRAGSEWRVAPVALARGEAVPPRSRCLGPRAA